MNTLMLITDNDYVPFGAIYHHGYDYWRSIDLRIVHISFQESLHSYTRARSWKAYSGGHAVRSINDLKPAKAQ